MRALLSEAEREARKRASDARYYAANRDRIKARVAEYDRQNRQEIAAKRAARRPHHHKGYEPGVWLDVEWLCQPCHGEAEE